MINLRNEKGSITLFVLISCLFFVASVACVQMYMQSKKIAVDREYRVIKSNYEGNTLEEENLKNDYIEVEKLNNINLNITKSTISENVLNVEFTINNTDGVSIKSIKYGWGTSESVSTVERWNFIENSNSGDTLTATNNNAKTKGDYYLFVVINNKIMSSKITVE